MRRRILFVDDEESILEGLRNRLRRQRTHWDMVFALGGAAALQELQRQPFDVVVSDMRMAGMDGVALLRCAKAEYPGVARLVLSGHADKEAILEVLPYVHQFLSKPCNADDLRLILERICRLDELLPNESARRLVAGMDKLPSVPDAHLAMSQAFEEPKVSLHQLARIVESDTAMSIKVLQLVNSAYFGMARTVNSVTDAVMFLGVELLKGLARGSQIFSAEALPDIEGFSLKRLQREAVLRARLARRFVADPAHAEEAFTAGLTHDAGVMAMALLMPDAFAEVLRVTRAGGRPQHQVERELLGFSHAEVGAYLQGLWGLPASIVEAIAHHHSPGDLTNGSWDIVGALHVADVLAQALTSTHPEDSPLTDERRGLRLPGAGLDLEFLKESGLLAHLIDWREIAAFEAQGNLN